MDTKTKIEELQREKEEMSKDIARLEKDIQDIDNALVEE